MENPDDVAKQELDWARLYASLEKILSQFGKSDHIGRADFWIVDDNWGCRQHKVYVNNLKMISSHIVKQLQNGLVEFPDWEIIIVVDVPGKLWPKMGLIIKPHEIIDGLQRQYIPKDNRFKYEGSRQGQVLNEA
jgi:hypothetical protein